MKQKSKVLCEICGVNESTNYCAQDICESCCKSGKCHIKNRCVVYKIAEAFGWIKK